MVAALVVSIRSPGAFARARRLAGRLDADLGLSQLYIDQNAVLCPARAAFFSAPFPVVGHPVPRPARFAISFAKHVVAAQSRQHDDEAVEAGQFVIGR